MELFNANTNLISYTMRRKDVRPLLEMKAYVDYIPKGEDKKWT